MLFFFEIKRTAIEISSTQSTNGHKDINHQIINALNTFLDYDGIAWLLM